MLLFIKYTLLLYYNQHPNWKNNKRTNAFEKYKTWVSNFNILSSIRKLCLAQHKMGRRIYYMILTPRQFYLISGIKPKFKSMLHLLPITLYNESLYAVWKENIRTVQAMLILLTICWYNSAMIEIATYLFQNWI